MTANSITPAQLAALPDKLAGQPISNARPPLDFTDAAHISRWLREVLEQERGVRLVLTAFYDGGFESGHVEPRTVPVVADRLANVGH